MAKRTSRTVEEPCTVAETVPVNVTLSITIADAEQLLELYKICESSDRHYKGCQADLFRRMVSSTYKAKAVESAFGRLSKALEAVNDTDGKEG